MFKEFLLAGFSTKKDEYIQFLNRLSDSVNGILESIKKIEESSISNNADETKSNLQNLTWLIDRFPDNHFEDLKKSFYIKRNDLFEEIESETEKALLSLKTNVHNFISNNKTTELAEKKIFIDLSEKLSTLTKKVRTFYFRIKTTTQLLFIIPVLLSFLLGLHYRFSDGFEKLSEDINWPQNAYQKADFDENKFIHTEQFSNKFWNEFSRFYFFKENNFKELYFSEEELDRYQASMKTWNDKSFQASLNDFITNSFKTKLVYKNNNATKPMLVYKITTEIDHIDNTPFPWENLIVTPELKFSSGRADNLPDDDVNTSHPWISFGSFKGIGPVIDLSWNAKLENISRTLNDSINVLHNSSSRFDLSDFHIIEVYDDSLEGELYLKDVEPPTDIQSLTLVQGEDDIYWFEYDDNFFLYDSIWYEIIYSVDRLREITEVSEKLTINYNYYSLKGDLYSGSSDMKLSDSLFYLSKRNLLIYDPREPVYATRVDASMATAAWDLIEKFVGAPEYLYKPKGVDLLVDTLVLDLNFEPKKSLSHNIDVIINPSGYVVAYILLDNLNNGVYNLNFQINENTISSFQFEYLKPDDFLFDYSDTKWLKEKLGFHEAIN
ncbi:MAG: hypothetical protein D8M58_05540 [Calditrichaeota bacterium]|nr:MAG: hypothetical protein DWQ03_20965 [Calditrichota bacterium]MBL1204839.1 hypothetical protein [Calditrichota bacterium]NOG44668.1 hypothetical protein [Calditrichota bacterium]